MDGTPGTQAQVHYPYKLVAMLIVREVTSECLVSTAALSETVAKQFLHLSNHSTVTTKEGPAEEGQKRRKALMETQASQQAVNSQV